MKVKKRRCAALALGFVLLAPTIMSAQAASPTPSPTKNPYGASVPVDPPGPNDVVLTVTNHFKVLHFSFNSLKKLGTSEISIYEPFVRARQTFTVVSLAKIFKSAGIPSSANISTVALNDYIYNDTAAHFTNSQGALAIARFGGAIPYDQGGPIRIIFPDKSLYSKNLNAWNWSLIDIKVK